MKKKLNMQKIAKGLRAERKGKVSSRGGWFGARQLLTEIEDRFRVPKTGGRATDPRWTERRLVPLSTRTLRRLEEIAAKVGERKVGPMQLAAMLLEKTTESLSEDEALKLARR